MIGPMLLPACRDAWCTTAAADDNAPPAPLDSRIRNDVAPAASSADNG
jgi:hypothetical protein